MSRYEPRADGEWVHWSRKGHLVACCDCGLVHLMRPRVRSGRVQIQATRMARNTAGRRRDATLRRAQEATKAEREACAKIVDDMAGDLVESLSFDPGPYTAEQVLNGYRMIANLIRARNPK